MNVLEKHYQTIQEQMPKKMMNFTNRFFGITMEIVNQSDVKEAVFENEYIMIVSLNGDKKGLITIEFSKETLLYLYPYIRKVTQLNFDYHEWIAKETMLKYMNMLKTELFSIKEDVEFQKEFFSFINDDTNGPHYMDGIKIIPKPFHCVRLEDKEKEITLQFKYYLEK